VTRSSRKKATKTQGMVVKRDNVHGMGQSQELIYIRARSREGGIQLENRGKALLNHKVV